MVSVGLDSCDPAFCADTHEGAKAMRHNERNVRFVLWKTRRELRGSKESACHKFAGLPRFSRSVPSSLSRNANTKRMIGRRADGSVLCRLSSDYPSKCEF